MSVLDWLVLVVWLGITLGGFWKGAVRIVFGIGGLLVGLWLAVMVGPAVAAWAAPWLGAGWAAAVIARVGLVMAAALVCLLAGWGLERTLAALHLGWLNRLAGAALAAAAAGLLLAIALAAAIRTSPVCRELGERSRLVPLLIGAVTAAEGPPQEPVATVATDGAGGDAASGR